MLEVGTNKAKQKRRLAAHKVGRLGEIIAVFVAGILTLLCGTAMFGNGTLSAIGSIWAANLAMLTVVQIGLWLRGQSWSHFGLHTRTTEFRSPLKTVLQSLVAFAGATLAFMAGAIVMALLTGIPERADTSQYAYLQGNLPLTLLALGSVLVVSAFAEEAIYRGFLITRLRETMPSRKSGSILAVVASSLIFGLIHSDWGLAGMVQTSCMGGALGGVYLSTNRNLWVVFLAHAYMDTLLVLQMYF
ncbi:MAG: CPBP family intramembrane metalloprotease [Planctomycetales bacterium]|nr:CPBP family intramembrane metalloprotease [Planctomycetales bacterium]